MFVVLSRFWHRLIEAFSAWRRSNLEAHRRGGRGDCCSAPDQVYAARRHFDKGAPS